jgi:alcohol oxidase
VAGRLAKASPLLQVLIIEAGIDNRDLPNVITPALFTSHQMPGSTTLLNYVSNPSEHLGGRSVPVGTGSILGGGSSVNFMCYARANAGDYDDWTTEGWSFKELLPLFKKVDMVNFS